MKPGAFKLGSNLAPPYHEVAREKHTHFALVDVEARRVAVVLIELDAVHRVLLLHGVVNLEVLHDDVLGLEPARDVVGPLTRRDVQLSHIFEVPYPILGVGRGISGDGVMLKPRNEGLENVSHEKWKYLVDPSGGAGSTEVLNNIFE